MPKLINFLNIWTFIHISVASSTIGIGILTFRRSARTATTIALRSRRSTTTTAVTTTATSTRPTHLLQQRADGFLDLRALGLEFLFAATLVGVQPLHSLIDHLGDGVL